MQPCRPLWPCVSRRTAASACRDRLPRVLGSRCRGAAPHMVPGGKVLWGGQGGVARAHRLEIRRHPAVFNYFISWAPRARTCTGSPSVSTRSHPCAARDAVGVPGGTGDPAHAGSHGEGDGFLVALLSPARRARRILYLRPLSEMNNGNNPYSPYLMSGRSRGRAFSTKQFKKAAAAGPDRPRRRGGRDRRRSCAG